MNLAGSALRSDGRRLVVPAGRTTELLIRLACRSAIRRGRQLTLPESTRLLEQLSRAATPAVCPHGAPIVLHFGKKFLERQFVW